MTDIPSIGSRREAREDALALLYEMEMTGDSVAASLARREPAPEGYAVEMAEGVASSTDELDELISRHLRDWRLERLTALDRTLARIAAWELSKRPEIPTGVVLSELVELATQYSGSEAPRFLNGLMRAVADEIRD